MKKFFIFLSITSSLTYFILTIYTVIYSSVLSYIFNYKLLSIKQLTMLLLIFIITFKLLKLNFNDKDFLKSLIFLTSISTLLSFNYFHIINITLYLLLFSLIMIYIINKKTNQPQG